MNPGKIDCRAVALGGGTGLPVVLKSLKGWATDITAIVTMADDGGSSGKLRQELGILPPGDIRNCLVALAQEEDGELVRMMRYRFPAGWSLAEHNLGNLMIAGMADYTGGFIEAIETLSRLLTVQGKVFPSTLDDVTLFADIGGGSVLAGQARIARTERIRHVHLEPRDAVAYAPAVEAINRADLIIIGPGSLFTSIIPNLLVLGIAEAIATSPARKVFLLNTMNMRRETFGMTGSDYLEALLRHVPERFIDTVVVHNGPPPGSIATDEGEVAHAVEFDQASASALGLTVIADDLIDESAPLQHDPSKLGAVLQSMMKVSIA